MAVDATRYREDYERYGFSATHKQVISWVSPGARVLELGCASGYIGRTLIKDKRCRVTGIEIDPAAAGEARHNGLALVEGSLEDPAFRASLTERFDFVLATDVLEHLRDPAPVLNDMKRWLLPHGRAIISVPNIATWRIRHQLFFRGDFEYQETGILDRTHLHFFTWRTLHKLLAAQQWSILETMVEEWELPVGRSVLVDGPRSARVYVQGLGTGRSTIARAIHSVLDGCALTLERSGRHLVDKLGRRWPNLCASHIALLLRPPVQNGGS
jgi:methionine biosynthesis protein MetW